MLHAPPVLDEQFESFCVWCSGMCTAKRIHVDDEGQTCRVGCPDEPDSLTHCNKFPLLYNIVITVWRNAGVFFHDLITQTLLRSLQSGIAVGGVWDAFVYVHNYHCRHTDNPGNFEDCMDGRIRLLTAGTPTYAMRISAFVLLGVPSSEISLLPENVVVTHEITCQGREHIVRIRSGERFWLSSTCTLSPT